MLSVTEIEEFDKLNIIPALSRLIPMEYLKNSTRERMFQYKFPLAY